MTNDSSMIHTSEQGQEPSDGIELVALWRKIAETLTGCIDGLGMCEPGDYLRLELIGPAPEGCIPPYYPYVQISATGELDQVTVEIPGNVLLHPLYALNEEQVAVLRRTGWGGNDLEAGDCDWTLEVNGEVDDYDLISDQLVMILRDYFRIAHPQMLTFRQKGLRPEVEDMLGLTETAKVPLDKPTLAKMGEIDGHAVGVAYATENREELLAIVDDVVGEFTDQEAEVDDDGDFVIRHMDQVVWVRVLQHQPAVEILARVAHGVKSPRGAAVEIGILNRDATWVTWTLLDRDIWQKCLIPAQPFAPSHLKGMLQVFFRAMAATRDDLVLRTGAETS
ncbi:MAG TPA: hypothetical protein GXZ30_11520 [Propionibacterium sp.]|nr:hypothetical protein [Propionibacterium sp.]